MHLFAAIPSDKVCGCGCHGIDTTDSMLGICALSMQTMLGGVRPLTNTDIQHVDAHKSLLAGMRLGLVVVVPSQGDWAGYQHIFGVPSWSGTMICLRRKSRI